MTNQLSKKQYLTAGIDQRDLILSSVNIYSIFSCIENWAEYHGDHRMKKIRPLPMRKMEQRKGIFCSEI